MTKKLYILATVLTWNSNPQISYRYMYIYIWLVDQIVVVKIRQEVGEIIQADQGSDVVDEAADEKADAASAKAK